MFGPLYRAISWILLQWHALWHAAFGDGSWLNTNWDWVLAIVFLVITIRAILFPVFVKQIKSQRAMQALAPQIKALQAKHKGDRETLQKEMMELYRREKTNPMMGCLPLVIQAPVMWSLFHVLRHLKPTMPEGLRTLYGWTLGQFDSASHAKLFGAPISAAFKSNAADVSALGSSLTNVRIVAGILVVTMIVTTYMTSRQMILKTGWAEDPQQRMIQRLMMYGIPVTLLFSGYTFPIGVVIYWTTTNLFSLGQQLWVLRKYPPPKINQGAATAKDGTTRTAPSAAAKALAPRPGAKPTTPRKGATKATTAEAGGTAKANGKVDPTARPAAARAVKAAAQRRAAQQQAQDSGGSPTVGRGPTVGSLPGGGTAGSTPRSRAGTERAGAPKPGAKPAGKKGSAKRSSG